MNDIAALERPAFAPGVFPDMPASVYHAIPALSSGGACRLRQSPAHFKVNFDNPKAPTPAMQLGTVIHCGILQPDLIRFCYAAAPRVDKRTTAGKAEWAAFQAEHAGKIILSAEDEKNALAAIAAVQAHPAARRLLDGATTELSLFWIDAKYQVPCKCRFDAINRGFAIDVKSTQDASPDAFAKSIANFEYHAQAAHYISGAEHALNEDPRAFVFIAVETEPPYAVACYGMSLSSPELQMGAHLTAIALERYAEALKTGVWHAYPDTVETIRLPRWALKFDLRKEPHASS